MAVEGADDDEDDMGELKMEDVGAEALDRVAQALRPKTCIPIVLSLVDAHIAYASAAAAARDQVIEATLRDLNARVTASPAGSASTSAPAAAGVSGGQSGTDPMAGSLCSRPTT